MRSITLVFPYYKNAGMLEEQFNVWNSYPLEIKEKLSVIVVDDGSPFGYRAEEAIASKNLVARSFEFRLYRILTDLRWNWLQCRNLAAHEADTQWLLLTDIDLVVPASVLQYIYQGKLDSNNFYTFGRIRKVDGQDYKPHPNSYLMTKKLYWKIGGYDETFAGHYGTDGQYRRQCEDIAEHVPLLEQKLVLYGREVIPDASTKPTDLDRKDNRYGNELDEVRVYKANHNIGKQVLRLPWKRVI